VTACSTGRDAMEYLLSSLRKLDFKAVDEAKQQAGVTYADTVRKVPVHDAAEGALRGPRFTPRSAAADVVAALGGLYPAADGFSPHEAEYAALMAEADKLTGTHSQWKPGAPIATGAEL
jgi:hypothetical protein